MRNSGEKDNDYHGRSGVWVGMWATNFPSLCLFFFFFTMISNGVDRMRVRKAKQERTNDRRNHEPRLL